MKTRNFTSALSTLCWCALITAAVGAGEHTIKLRESLNCQWTRQLVSYPFRADNGACLAKSVRLTGPGGPVAAQLANVQTWPGTQFVQRADLVFVVDDLPPLVEQTYKLTYAPAPGAPSAGASDLTVKPGAERVELSTGRIGVRLALGAKKYNPAVRAAQVPGPLLGMRLGTGPWAGASSLVGEGSVTSWSAELTDSGPVFARVSATYTMEDGNVVGLTATVVAGDNAVRCEMSSREDRPAMAFEMRLPPVPGVKQAVLPKGYGQWAKADRTLDVRPGPEPLTFLSPNTSMASGLPDCPSTVRLAPATGGGLELWLGSRDPAAWSEPVAPLTYAGFKHWDLETIPKMWEVWRRNRLPIHYAADGTVTLRAGFTKGARKWWTGCGPLAVGDQLDWVKNMVLDWPADPRRPHPRLFVGMADVKDAWARAAGDAELAKLLSGGPWAAGAVPLLMQAPAQRKKAEVEALVKSLEKWLGIQGNFDVMRAAIGTATLYDALVDSDLITPRQKATFRAQMAYLGYLMADPQCWSMERGYLTGNPNMSCSYTLSLGVIACALADHPAAKAWADRATQWMDKWLSDEVGPNGEWMPEGSHYGYVSLEPMLVYAIAAKRAGFHDFSSDPRLKRLILYFAKHNTPRDVQRNGLRSIGAYGRGHGGCLAVFGIAARFYKNADPTLSRTLQWMWLENGSPFFLGDGRLGGCEPCYADRRLPAEAPAWTSEFFPNLGVLLRAGFNTPEESYVQVLAAAQSMRNLDLWTPGIGEISQWFGRGKPLSTCFTFAIGYNERHELLRNGVRLARNWGAPNDPKGPFGHYTQTRFGEFAALPTADYVRTRLINTHPDDRDWFPDNLPAYPKVKPATASNLDWTRQVLFLKDLQAAGPAWMLVRDTTTGAQPTAWQFWTLSEKVVPADRAADPARLLADKPGQVQVAARELPRGNRYTALGQFGVDVEYFIASPATTPRHTLRYGGMWAGNRIPEYQDLLHLQMPGDGAYYVAIFPRPRAEAPPAFAALSDGRLIKATGGFGTDYAMLTSAETEAAAEGVSVKGTCASVQVRQAMVVLALGAPGEVRYKDHALSLPAGAASLRVEPTTLTVSLPAGRDGGQVTVTAPGVWSLEASAKNIALTKPREAVYQVTVPADVTQVKLVKRP
jgi:hypothetical protein